jgi:hypothetical protein
VQNGDDVVSEQKIGPVVLLVRGKTNAASPDAARALHNDTAGAPDNVAAARALGDLSHVVFAPCLRSKFAGATAGELLFWDIWEGPEGVMQFFSHPGVQALGQQLFASREASVWMAARGSYALHLPAPRGRRERYLGVIRGPIASPEHAIETFRAADEKATRDARRRGLLSHQLFIKLNPPGASDPLELLGLDLWCDFDGMTAHYSDEGLMAAVGGAFSGRPSPSVWEQGEGWSEW